MNDNKMKSDVLDVQLPTAEPTVPGWLWDTVRAGFAAVVTIIAGLALAVALGIADPKPVGNLKWEDHFATLEGWQVFGPGVQSRAGGVMIALDRETIAGAVIPSEGLDYTFEVAGGQATGEVGARFGIVFSYQNAHDYSAVMINGNSYVEVIGTQQTWLPWQQWPNILLGYEANQVRLDVTGGEGVIRINDEVLITVPVKPGAVGFIAGGSAAGQQVRVGWAKLWGK